MKVYDIAIIIPVFQESKSIGKVLTEIDNSILDPTRVYLIADDSSDPTLSVAKEVANGMSLSLVTLVQNELRGPANAIKLGIELSEEKYVIFMTGDDSDNPRDIPKLIAELTAGSAVVCASRYAKGGKHIGGPFFKHLLSRFAGKISNLVFIVPTCDPTNLYKATTRDFLNEITIESKFGFTIGLEIVGKANSKKMKITEIPTVWNERKLGNTTFKLIKWLPSYIYWFLRIVFPSPRRFGIK